jgi:hypothetical protein
MYRAWRVTLFGRDELAWDEMAEVGEAFLVERARLARLTIYTEPNTTLRATTWRSRCDSPP